MALDPNRFSLRRRNEQLFKVELDREATLHMPEALSHVGKQVFDSDRDERYYLYDAGEAVRQAVQASQGSSGRKIAVEFTLNELTHMPEALRHVAHEVFDGEDDRSYRIQNLLYGASKDVQEALEANAPSSGPRR